MILTALLKELVGLIEFLLDQVALVVELNRHEHDVVDPNAVFLQVGEREGESVINIEPHEAVILVDDAATTGAGWAMFE